MSHLCNLQVAAVAHEVGIHARPAPSLAVAMAEHSMDIELAAVRASQPVSEVAHGVSGPPRILVCGSLYLAGVVLRDHA